MSQMDEILRRIAANNHAARSRFESLAHRTVVAVVNGDRGAFSEIIKDAGIDDNNDEGNASGQSETSGLSTVETGDADRNDRNPQPATTQADEPSQSGS